MQAAPTIAETRFLLQLAPENPFIAGVFGWTDLESPTAADDITELALDESLVGLRPMVQDLPDDEWLLRPSLAPAIDAMQRAGLRLRRAREAVVICRCCCGFSNAIQIFRW